MPPEALVHVIDDDADVRQSMALLFQVHDIAMRAHAGAKDFLAAAGAGIAGCVLSDVRMPGLDGIELLRRLRLSGLDLPVIVMSGHADVPMAVRAMKEGAFDFIEKPFDDVVILTLVRQALAKDRQAAGARHRLSDLKARIASLTPREREVLEMVAAGKANKIIGRELNVSPRTVEVHRAKLMTKMGAENAVDVARMFRETLRSSET
ncbi:DNA-binding response regulator [Aureimonas endophytica]|uniref:DNA-binding response regulator n=1 Tax=Aureimonas endophytica TaxID=2027858 RepID=A0A916ZRD6_9HYPH|nr:response regulator [Aureimonas endophytica]GGE09017.1 DNA-binding response regulator [Aureimonas endophytica]